MMTRSLRRTAGALALFGLLLAAPPALAQVTLHTAAEKAAYEAATPARPAPAAARQASAAAGDLLVPRDDTFTLALAANDDGSTDAIPLPFAFNLYGTTYDEVYINNNGNVTFTERLGTFTPFAFPSATPIVAPFFADVDTRGTGSGLVYYKSEPSRFTVVWEDVGYFNRQTDKRNTFQLVLTDGADPLVGAGRNVCLSYGDMNWTTGSASGGSNGFGGTAAIAGANAGDGASFFTLGRFDQAGDAYDGPGGASDGVDYLDDRDVCFSTSDSETNVPPIAQGIADGDAFDLAFGTELVIDFSFLSPEADQTTEITSPDFDAFGEPSSGGAFEFFDGTVSFDATAGNPATGQIRASIAPGLGVTGGGSYDVALVACDDADDFECTEITITINVESLGTRSCEPGDWYVIDFSADGEPSPFSGGEYVRVYASGPGPLDLSGCDFVAFNPFSERVTLSVPLDGVTLGAFEDVVILEGGADFPEGSIPDGPGAIAFVQGDVAVGATVQSVLGRVAHSVVYFRDDNIFGVFPAGSPLDPDPGARRAGGEADLSAQLAALRAEPGDVGPALAVGPNPVRGAGAVAFRLDAEADVRLAVYDVLGREVTVLAEGAYGAGSHRASFDAAAFPAGAYVVRLTAGGVAHTARLTVVR
ncbi:T9SS type A sorting domain-containing protein [Rubrivirga sp. S365]|uniref:T9SS type A sorting domain-containing protein n=1 Tax=Rubrivirga litoralis TaxID=3075598 RepID=A0ABU3BQ23_9BACT|nr:MULTISPECIES: nidogen-like domain-containing protein [unclassified Rubrivirga]MDT0631368.1 T9SS type A sorting domain-containing protein [Rubrivirga sp. F394]MDT7855959.1 T9SS type A sorting domain-containing protein [Rubrivirga sp. S365]